MTSNLKSQKTSNFTFGFRVHSLKDVTVNPNIPTSNKKSKNKKNRRSNTTEDTKNTDEAEQKFNEDLQIECTSSSITKLLNTKHLNASTANSLHDLQCGTGLLILQSFLEFPLIRRVFGIESNKQYFQFAHKNAMKLVKNGYHGRRFLLVENIPNIKITIAEKCMEDNIKHFKSGELVTVFISLKSNINKRENYQAIISKVNPDGIHYTVQMARNKKIVPNVHRQVIFHSNVSRTLEIYKGNLFERPDSFRADIICLPYSVSNESFKALLITGCKRSAIGARLLSYHCLEYWDGFPEYSLRRIDANVFNNDKYDTNKCSWTSLYLYENVQSPLLASSVKRMEHLVNVGSIVNVRDDISKYWFTAEVLNISTTVVQCTHAHAHTHKNRTQHVFHIRKHLFVEHAKEEHILVSDQRLQIIHHRFKQSEIIACYCVKKIKDSHADMYHLYRAQILRLNMNGTYIVQYEDGEVYQDMKEIYMFNVCRWKYREGQILMSERYDLIDTHIALTHKMQDRRVMGELVKEKCIVRHRNADGSYRVEFYENDTVFQFHDHFYESWMYAINDDEVNDVLLPICYEIDYDKIPVWRPNMVGHWMRKCGILDKYCELFVVNNVNGIFLFDLDLNLLMNEFNICRSDSVNILKYIRVLKNEVHVIPFNDEQQMVVINEKIKRLQLRLGELESAKKQIHNALSVLYESNKDAKTLYEYELTLKCIELHAQSISKKDIAQKLSRGQKWVQKHWNLDVKKMKKPVGKIIAQIELMTTKAQNIEKKLVKLQLQLQREQMQLHGNTNVS